MAVNTSRLPNTPPIDPNTKRFVSPWLKWLQEIGIVFEDVKTDLANKATLSSSASGNLAEFDSSGNLVDSGITAADATTSAVDPYTVPDDLSLYTYTLDTSVTEGELKAAVDPIITKVNEINDVLETLKTNLQEAGLMSE